jgi:hypothetical protein
MKRIMRKLFLFALLSLLGMTCAACITITIRTPQLPLPIVKTATPTPSPTLTPTITPTPQPTPTPTLSPRRIFDEFVNRIKTGEGDRVVGVYTENIMALPVIYQPSNNPAFVSNEDGIVTYFLLPWRLARNHGFLAHNYLSGALFYSLQVGDIVQVVYGDGNYEDFEVLSIRQLQALSPNSTRSTFIDLETGASLSATTLFNQVYRGEYHSTLQTCLAQGGLDNWGRYFVLAPPLY